MNQQNIRNFCIIAHIDHGKSTLADRLIELTHTVENRKMKEQLLDQMDLERERGITIKLQPVKMMYRLENQKSKIKNQNDNEKIKNDPPEADSEILNFDLYTLNLIDTPGHVDFHYEVSRSLAAVEGAILLVDATKGVQAQTLANLYLAIEQGLTIIPVVNKIDLPNAEVEKTKKEIVHILGCEEGDILEASGKTGLGVKEVLERVIEQVPAPKGDPDKPLRALIFDSVYDTYKGVVAYVRVVDGVVSRDVPLRMIGTGQESLTIEVGTFAPQLFPVKELMAGDIGYIATGLKDVSHCRVGDTITIAKKQEARNKKQEEGVVRPLPGYKEIKSVVYASLYPVDGGEYGLMRDALEKLKLNDAAFTFEPESNQALGRGFRCGFLGLLHMEIIQERLRREFDMDPTITTPSVVYELEMRGKSDRVPMYSPVDMPDPAGIERIYEPYVSLSIVAPAEFLGNIMNVSQSIRAEYKNTEYLDADRVLLSFEAPLMEVIVNFHDELKSVTQGYASMNYEPIGYRPSDVVKLDILVAGDRVDAFSRMIPKARSYDEGKRTVEKLKEVIPRQNFAVAIQAAIGGTVIARETIAAFRKDVTGKLYGGDFSRKKKLLEKQKRGKKKMKALGQGRVSIPSDAFLAILKK